MSDPRYRPWEMAEPADRRKFGKSIDITWAQAKTYEMLRRIEAARLQHEFALVIHRRLEARNESIRQYSARAGIGYDRMAKVLRGEAIMRLEDIADADRLLGGIIPPRVTD